MGKKFKKAKSVEKVFVKERTVCISQDFMLKMVRVKMDISKRCPKQKNGLLTQSMKIHII